MDLVTSIHLENFKSFGQHVNVPLAPITLIFGENSAGKTSILQSLYLLKQTIKHRYDTLVPSIDNGIVDLGSVEELLFDHDINLKLKLGITMDYEIGWRKNLIQLFDETNLSHLIGKDSRYNSSYSPRGLINIKHKHFSPFTKSKTIEFTYKYQSKERIASSCQIEIFDDEIGLISRFQSIDSMDPKTRNDIDEWLSLDEIYSILSSKGLSGEYETESMVKRFSRPFHPDTRWNLLYNTYVTDSKIFWEHSFKIAINEQKHIVNDLHDRLSKFLKKWDYPPIKDAISSWKSEINILHKDGFRERIIKLLDQEKSADDVINSLRNWLLNWETDPHNLTEDKESSHTRVRLMAQLLISLVAKQNYERAIKFYENDFSIDEFISRMQNEHLGDTILFKPESKVSFGSSLLGRFPERKYSNSDLLMPHKEMANVVKLAVDSCNEIKLEMNRIRPIGPHRSPPDRWYKSSGIYPDGVGNEGNFLPELLFQTPKLVQTTNEWLNNLGIQYKLQVDEVQSRFGNLFEIRFLDMSREIPVDVNGKDLGFGVSQVLPIVVQCLDVKDSIIMIQQPELHIHPRLQANLGDLFVESLHNRSNQLIIETHSEHLVLRLQKLIRTGKITPDEVSILYVSRNKKGSQVERLHMDDNGEFIDEWPGGFFPERLDELL